MENGVRFDDGSNLTEQLANLSVGDGVNGCRSDVDNINGMNKSDGLFQVMKAVEAAEATIKQQKSRELKAKNSHPAGHWDDNSYLPPTKSPIVLNKDFRETQKVKEVVTMVPSGHTMTNNGGMFSSASTSSFSPSRYQPAREYDPQFNVSGHGLVSTSEVVIDTRDQEQEILLLRKRVADYSIKGYKV